jgi:hypothetical protein
MKHKGRTWSDEQKQLAAQRMRERWENRKGPSPDSPPASSAKGEPMIDPITEQTRAEAHQRLQQTMEANKLEPGEVPVMPPDPPASYGRLPEVGRGGAIGQRDREIGVDLSKPEPQTSAKPHTELNHHPLKPDYVRRRGEPKDEETPAPVPIREDIAPIESSVEPDGVVLNIPNWETMPLEECEPWLQILREEETRAAEIVNRRRGETGVILNHCANPACGKVVPDGKEAFSKTIRDPKTNLFTRLVICSARCWAAWSKGPGMPRPAAPGAHLTSRA